MKVFIPYADESGGINAPLVPYDNRVMRVVRITSLGDHKNAVTQIITEIEHERSKYHFEPKKRYGDTTGTGTIDF